MSIIVSAIYHYITRAAFIENISHWNGSNDCTPNHFLSLCQFRMHHATNKLLPNGIQLNFILTFNSVVPLLAISHTFISMQIISIDLHQEFRIFYRIFQIFINGSEQLTSIALEFTASKCWRFCEAIGLRLEYSTVGAILTRRDRMRAYAGRTAETPNWVLCCVTGKWKLSVSVLRSRAPNIASKGKKQKQNHLWGYFYFNTSRI